MLSSTTSTSSKGTTARHHVARIQLPDGRRSWTVVGPDHLPVEAVDRFLSYLEAIGRSPNTVSSYAYDLRAFLEFLDRRGVGWADVDLDDVAAFVDWLERPAENVLLLGGQPSRARSTVARAVSAVHAYFDYHARSGVPVADRLTTCRPITKGHYRPWLAERRAHTERQRVIAVKVPTRAPNTLTAEQVAALLAACTRLRDRFLLALLYETGMRVGQALGLRHADVVSRQRLIRIVPRTDNANGARAKTTSVHEVSITGELVRLYSDYLVTEYGSLDSDYVFVNLWGEPLGHPMTKSGVNELVRRLRARTGIDFVPHMLRHTHATELGRASVPVEVISKRLTHASLSTTLDICVHLGVEDQRRAIEDAGFWRKAES